MKLNRCLSMVLAGLLLLAAGCSGGLVPEYLRVEFEPGAGFALAGNCPPDIAGDALAASDVAVLIEGACQGRVGEVIPLTHGSFEVSVDVVGAEMQVVELEGTTARNPKVVTIEIK